MGMVASIPASAAAAPASSIAVKAAPVFEALAHRVQSRKQGIQHGLVAGYRFAPLPDTFDARLEQRHHIGGFDFDFPGASRGGPKKKGAVQRPGGAAYMADEHGGHVLKNGTDIGRSDAPPAPLSPP